MQTAFVILTVLVLASAIAAMTLRNLVHCALCVALTFLGLAGLYLQLEAQFIGLAQILVYVGAVAILIVFAILLTRSREGDAPAIYSGSWKVGLGIAILVFASIAFAVFSGVPRILVENAVDVKVQQIGAELMSSYVLPLELIALLLTAATIGAVIIAMHERKP